MILKTNSDFYSNSINEFVVTEEQCAFHEAETELLNTIHIIVMLKRAKPVESGNIPTICYTERYALYATQLRNIWHSTSLFQQFVSVNKINMA
jgi:hypothetical protein